MPGPTTASPHTGLQVLLWTLTLLRVALLPVFLGVAARAEAATEAGLDPSGHRLLLVAVLLAMGLSDLGDGWVARRYGLATQVGAVVDAVADKLVQVTVAAFFALADGSAFTRLPLWFLALVVARDAVLGAGWLILRSRRVPVRVVHRLHGRASSVGVFLVFFALILGLPRSALPLLLAPVTLLVVASTVAYVRDGVAQLPERDGHRRRAGGRGAAR